ncbi:MAG: glycosyltransferase [Paludibacteraceae bacterium]|nr:glycosyltransferase [Paludibacteraceae bacterium]
MDFASLHIVDYILLGSLLLLFVLQMYFYIRYLAAPARKMRRDKIANDQMVNAPGVSVILAAHNESYNLSQYLQALLSQDYPLYEVIVVDDGSEDSTRDVVERYMTSDPRLKMSFVPYGARVRSTKKLAITLAAKAAKYDYLLLTDADCVPESSHWISEMMSGFQLSTVNSQLSTDIVLGFGAYFMHKSHLNRLIQFDTLFNGLHYLGAALCGHPYMGVGRNLAYKKSLFFESGGFSHLMITRAGDDDLFVNHVATRTNTSVVISRESLTWSPSKRTFKEWWQQKRRHLSVSPQYRTSTKCRLAFEPLTRGLFYVALICALVYYFLYTSYIVPLYIALGLFLLRWIVQTVILNTSARRLGLKSFNMCSILWFDIVLPLINLWMLVVPKRNNKW